MNPGVVRMMYIRNSAGESGVALFAGRLDVLLDVLVGVQHLVIQDDLTYPQYNPFTLFIRYINYLSNNTFDRQSLHRHDSTCNYIQEPL